VATDWTALGQTAIGAAAAIGGGFVGACMQGASQQRMESQRQRERAAELAGIAMQLHIDSSISTLGQLSGRDATQAALEELRRRHGQVRAQLWMLGGSHPEEAVRSLAIRLPGQMIRSLNAATDYVMDCINEPGRDHAPAWRAAEESYIDTLKAIAKLLRAMEHS
jgi:hypothetical protein